jgi:hypothetical protein
MFTPVGKEVEFMSAGSVMKKGSCWRRRRSNVYVKQLASANKKSSSWQRRQRRMVRFELTVLATLAMKQCRQRSSVGKEAVSTNKQFSC